MTNLITSTFGANPNYRARMLADSISLGGIRLCTIEARFPRFILAEMNTHRVFSRNSASSRAIPTEKLIESVRKNPFIPETFNQRVKGMGVGAALADEAAIVSRDAWLFARDKALTAADVLVDMNVDKSRVNRLLEPFMWHTAIISSTEWENFFALREPTTADVPDFNFGAQPEFQIIARLMHEVMDTSEPMKIAYDSWHLPLVSLEERSELTDGMCKLLSASRCARVSFDKHTDTEPREVTLERAEKLIKSGHLSPFEHQATPLHTLEWCGNFRRWFQFRKEIPHESDHAKAVAAQAEVTNV